MSFLIVALITAINGALVLGVGYLAVSGDGSPPGTKSVWLHGGLWVAAFAVASIALLARRRSDAAIGTAISAMPAALGAMLVSLVVSEMFKQLRPNSSALKEACKTAELVFLAAPSAPVTSIAYD